MSRYIDADAALNAIKEAELGCEYEAVEAVPTADVVPTEFHDKCMQIEIEKRMDMERKRGEWKHKSKQLAPLNTLWWYECSSCGYHAFNGMTTEFCPNCGARMTKE